MEKCATLSVVLRCSITFAWCGFQVRDQDLNEICIEDDKGRTKNGGITGVAAVKNPEFLIPFCGKV